MSAHLMVLQDWLLGPAMSGALTLQEAWAVQDMALLQDSEWTMLPPSYRQVGELLFLFHQPAENQLPL
jgi:hypothetical protein